MNTRYTTKPATCHASRVTRHRSPFTLLFLPLLAAGLLASLLAGSAQALTNDWTGAANTSMTNRANWVTAPVTNVVPTAADVARWNASSYGNEPTADAGLTIGQLMFDSGNTAGVTIGGSSALTLNRLDGVGLQINNGSGAITINAPITFGFAQTWVNNLTSGSGALTLGGTFVNGQKLTINGPGDTTITGPASHSMLAMNGTGTLTLGGWSTNSTFTMYVNSGTVLLDKSDTGNNVAIPSTLSIGQANTTTSTVQYVGLSTNMIANAAGVTIYGAGRLDFNGKTDIIGALAVNSTGATNDTTPVANSTPGSGNLTITTLGITPLPGYTTTIDAGASGTLTLGGNVTFAAAGSGVAQINGNMYLGSTPTFSVGNGDADNDLTINATISGGTGLGLTLAGAGRTVLIGNNTFSGPVTSGDNDNNVLNIRHSNALGTTAQGTTVRRKAALELQGGIAVGAEPLLLPTTSGTGPDSSGQGALRNISGNNSWNGPITLGGNTTRINSDSGTLTLNSGATIGGNYSLWLGGVGNISILGDIEIANATGLTKDGAGKLTLSAANLKTGPTTVNGGTLALDLSSGSSSKTWLQAAALTLSKGSIELKGGSQTEIFASTAINGGSFAVTRPSGTSKLRLNALTRAIGNTIDFAADNLADTDNINASGILSGYATVASNTWARSADFGTDISITGLPDSGYVENGAYLQGSTLSTSNLDMRTVSQNTTVTNPATINSIRFNTAEAKTITINPGKSLTVTSGGILNTATVGSNPNTIDGTGTISGSDLKVHQYNTANALRIDSIVAGANFTKTGPGTLILGGDRTNAFTGAAYVNGGELDLEKRGVDVQAISSTTLTINQNGVVKYTGATLGASTNMINNACAVTINEAGQLDFNGKTDTIGAVTINSTGAGGNTTPIKNSEYVGTLTISTLGITPVSPYTTTVDSGTVVGTLKLAGDLIFYAAGYGVAQINGILDMNNGAPRTFTVANGEADNDLVINAVVNNGALTKLGAGRMVLAGNNGYTNATIVSAGILTAANSGALGTTDLGTTVNSGPTLELQGDITVGPEKLSLNGGGVYSYGALRNVSGNNIWGGPVALAAGSTINSDSGLLTINVPDGGAAITNAFALTIGGAGNVTISDPIAIGANALTKNGAGTLTLAGTNTFTGATTVSGGTLKLDFGALSGMKIWTNGVLTLSKGTLTLSGGTYTQEVKSTTLSPGSFAVTRSGGTSVLRMNAITRAAGSTIDFSADGIADTDTANTNGILVGLGYATVNGTTWAMSGNGTQTNTPITGLPDSGYVTNGAYLQGSTLTTSNLDMRTASQDTTVQDLATINSIRFNTAEAKTITINDGKSLTVTSGGILNTAAVGANNNAITNGTIKSGSTDLKIHQYNTGGTLTINSIVEGAGFTKTGPGTLILGGASANTFTVGAYVNGGELDLDKSDPVSAIPGAIALTINQTGVVKYTGTSTNMIGTGAVTINENGQLDFNGASDMIGAITINSTGASGNTTPIKNTLGGGNLTITTLTITPLSLYTTRVDTASGTLTLGGDVTFTAAGSGMAQISGNLSLGALTRIFTVGDSDVANDLVIDAVISGAAGAGIGNKTGAGRLVLGGANTFSGPVTVAGGILTVANASALGASGGLLSVNGTTVNSTYTLELLGGIAVGAEALSLNNTGLGGFGALRNVSGNNSWAGPISLVTTGVRINSEKDTLTLSSDVMSVGLIGLTIGGAGDTTISGALDVYSLTKDGTGTLTLSGANKRVGQAGITVSGGKLALDYTGADNLKITDAGGPVLTLSKSTLDLTGTGSATQSVGSVSIGVGQSAITRSSGASVLRINQITRALGGTIDFAADGIADTDSVNANGILASTAGLVGFATVGSNTWARSADSGTDLSITGLPDIGYVTNTATTLGGITTSNCDVRVADTAFGATTINSIRFNEPAKRTLTLSGILTVTSGGILNTAAVGADNTNTITGSTLTSGAELKIHQHNTGAPLRIDSAVGIALTKSGPGTLILGGATANSGNVIVNGGELDLDKSAAAQAIGGSATLTINQNGVVKYTGTSTNMIHTGSVTINENGQLDFNGKSDMIGAIAINSTGASGNTTPIKNSTPASGNLTITTLGITPLTGYRTLIDTGSGGTNTLGGTVNFYAAGSGWAQISGNLSLNNASRDFSVADGEAFNDMVVDAAIVGGGSNGALSKSGAGRLVLSGNNTYSGLTSLTLNSDGFLRIRNSDALGSTAAGTVVPGRNSLELDGGITVGAEMLTLSGTGTGSTSLNQGALRNVSGTNIWGGTVTLGAASRINSDSGLLKLNNNLSLLTFGLTVGGLGNAGDVEINGVISGTTGSLTKDGLGTLTLGGSSANTFNGLTTVQEGTLVLSKSSGVAVTNLTITGGNSYSRYGLVRYGYNTPSAPMISGTVTINANGNGCGQLDFNDATDTIGTVNIAAAGAISDSRPIINTGSGGVLTINSLNITPVAQYISTLDSGSGTFNLGGNVTFTAAATGQAKIGGNLNLNGTRIFNVGSGSGPIYDLGISAVIANGDLTKVGTGRLYLSGVNTYTGTTLVQTGTVEVALSGSIAASTNVTVNANATLIIDRADALGPNAVVYQYSAGATKGTINLNFSGTQLVTRLYFDGVSQTLGVTWGAPGSGAANESSFFTGRGFLMAGGNEPFNLPVTTATTNSATLTGKLWAVGDSATAVCVLWGDQNGGRTWNWANTNWLTPPVGGWVNGSPLSINITDLNGLLPNKTYYYTFGATNATRSEVAADPLYFITGDVTVNATDATAQYEGNTGEYTIYRPLGCTNEQLVVYYAMSGTASNGVHYNLLPGSAKMDAGSTSTVVTLTPVFIGVGTAILTLQGGSIYPVGASPNDSATVTIDETVIATPSEMFVSTNSPSPAEPYNTWHTAARSVKTAMDLASILYPITTTVTVSNGAYGSTGEISITNAITLRSVNGADVTTIYRSEVGTVQRRVVGMNHADAVLNGFTVTNGFDGRGAGIELIAGTVVNSTIARNRQGGYAAGYPWPGQSGVFGTGLWDYGAGMYVGPGGVVSNCLITGNSCNDKRNGGGIFLEGGVVRYSTICGNSVFVGEDGSRHPGVGYSYGFGGGAGIYSSSADSLVEFCVITNNTLQGAEGPGGGAGYCGKGTLRNCLIAQHPVGSYQGQGGGLWTPGELVMDSCTVAGNAAKFEGGGIYSGGLGGMDFILNSIVYNNRCTADASSPSSNYFGGSYSYSCAAPLPAGEGNIKGAPQFVNATKGDYRLFFCPAVNAGINDDTWMSGALDLAGSPRIWGEVVDMGAYEYIDAVRNQPVTDVTTTSATFNGKLLTGSSATAVCVLWGDQNGGQTWNWANTNWFPADVWPDNTLFSTNITTGITVDKTYYYTFAITNATNAVVAANSETFITGEVTVRATDPIAQAFPLDTGEFTITRPLGTTNEALTVYYTMSGTATNGTHYTLPGSPVTMDAGVTNATLTLTAFSPLAGDAILTLDGGHDYPIGVTYEEGGIYTAKVTIVGSTLPSEIFVSTNGTHTAPYETWEKAATNVQIAVQFAKFYSPGVINTVTVSNGTYHIGAQIAIIGHPITVRSVNGADVTTILQDAGYTRVVYIDDVNAVLDGFTVSGGNDIDKGVGVYLNAGTVRNCLITGNIVNANVTKYGVGMYVEADGVVSNCQIIANYAADQCFGTGIYLNGGKVRRSNISNNTAGGTYGHGGVGILSTSTNSLVEFCVITNNRLINISLPYPPRGGGGYYGPGTLRNCLIAGNYLEAGEGGGVSGTIGLTVLENCTIANNQAGDQILIAGYYSGGGGTYNCTVINSIVYTNNAGTNVFANWFGGSFDYSCTTPLPGAGVGNIDGDPQFVNADAGDYRLLAGSPCVDEGTNLVWMIGEKDLAGLNRILTGRKGKTSLISDMGAYETFVPFRNTLFIIR